MTTALTLRSAKKFFHAAAGIALLFLTAGHAADVRGETYASTGTATTCSISGIVLCQGTGLSGVTLRCWQNTGEKSTVSGSDGRYVLSDLTTGYVSIIVDHPDYTFEPSGYTENYLHSSLSNINFAVKDRLYRIFGTVTSTMTPTVNVTVRASNGSIVYEGYAVGYSTGLYVIQGIPAGSYTVTPQAATSGTYGLVFSPASRTVTLGPTVYDMDFTAFRIPAVSITTPTVNSILTAPAVIPLQAAARELNDTITRVEFYANNILIAVSTLPVSTMYFNSSWNCVSSGTYTLTAKAYDSRGLSTTSREVVCKVKAAPPLAQCIVSGKITMNGVGLAGVSLTAYNNGAYFQTISSATGSYLFAGLNTGTLIIIPDHPDYTFQPSSFTTSIQANLFDVNFTATPRNAYVVSGNVAADGAGLPGIRVKIGWNNEAVTDSSGNYSLAIPYPGTYVTARPEGNGWRFTPEYIVVASSRSMTDVDFQAYPGGYALSGKISREGGIPFAGVTIALSSGVFTTSAADGSYAFTNLPKAVYTLTVTAPGYVFNPPSGYRIEVWRDITDMDFCANFQPFSIAGKVTRGGSGLAGVTVTNGLNSATTDSEGNYLLSDIAGGTQTIRALLPGYGFTPWEYSIPVTQSIADLDFTARPGMYTVYGKIFRNGAGLAGVSVWVSGQKVVTDAAGSYALQVSSSGVLQVRPVMTGYAFNPEYQNIVVETDFAVLPFAAQLTVANLEVDVVSQPVDARTPTTVTIQARDANGDPVDCSNQVVTVCSSGGKVLPETVILENGAARADLKVQPDSARTGNVDVWFEYQGKRISRTMTLAAKPLFAPSINAVRIYPSPSYHGAPVKFSPLESGATIKIYTISGELVREAAPSTASWEWNLRNADNEEVASGIYIYLVGNGSDQTKKGTFAVLK